MKAELEPIVSGEGGSFYARRFEQKAFDHPLHYHPEVELVYIERSSGTLIVGDHIGSFAAGECYFLGANLPHIFSQSVLPSGGAASEVLHFRCGQQGEPSFTGSEWARFRELLNRASLGLQYARDASAHLARHILAIRRSSGLEQWAHFIELAQCLIAAEPSEVLATTGYTNTWRSTRSGRMEQVCQYLLEHFKEDLSHREIAGRFHMAPASFSRAFKKATRKTFQAFISELRLGYACRKLTETDAPITQIAYESGFNNLSNFNRRFKLAYALSPHAYRRNVSKLS